MYFKNYFDIKQAAEYLGVSPATIRKLIKNKSITARYFTNKFLIKKSELDEFAEKQPTTAGTLADFKNLQNKNNCKKGDKK